VVLVIVDVLVIMAFISEIYSLDLWVMYCTRFIFGLFCGISSSIIPVYLTSIAPLKISGIIGSFNQLLITIGIATAYGLDFLI
jgi:MFS family permease